MTRALVDNAADPQQVESGKRSERMQQKDQDERWYTLVSSYDGRAVLWEIMGWSQPYKTTFTHGDPYATSFHEGERNMSLRVLARIETLSPTAYQQMHAEAMKRRDALTAPRTKRTPSESEESNDRPAD